VHTPLLSPFKTILVFALSAGIGWMLLPLLPVDLQPDTRPPVLTITANLPGSPPETVEQEITAPSGKCLLHAYRA